MVYLHNKKEVKTRYNEIDGLRMIACFGIVLMHILSNLNFSLPGYWPNLIISELTNLVFLFMMISSFGLSCGYYEKIKNNSISPEKFYSKRIYKILPFFLLLIILDILIDHSIPSIIEGFADMTLLFGYLQKDISVIGVGWFIGLVFIFYLMFPFFTYLFSNKKRAWLTTIVAILMNLSSIYYFKVGRTNMFYSFLFFCIGGLIYLYRENIIHFLKNKKVIGLLMVIISIIIYFLIPNNNEYLKIIRIIIVSASLLCYAISYESKLLYNKVTKYIGSISLEIYLCHMMIYKILEKTHIINMFNNDWLSYSIISIIVLIGAILFSTVFVYCWKYFEKKVLKNENIIS